MSRLMSVSYTSEAVRARTKTVTRRKGWLFLNVGDRLTLCEKVMGRKAGEPLVRITEVEVISVHREPLSSIDELDVRREGFLRQTPRDFVRFFVHHMGGSPDQLVTRIEWRYLDGA